MSSSRDDLARVAGSDAMAKPKSAPPPQSGPATGQFGGNPDPSDTRAAPKKKRHRAGKHRNKKGRRKSFAAPSEGTEDLESVDVRPDLADVQRESTQQASFYRLQTNNRSNTSLESEALLDHRGHQQLGARRQSIGFSRPSIPFVRHRNSQASAQPPGTLRPRQPHVSERAISEDEADMNATDRTPLLGVGTRSKSKPELSRNNSGMNTGTPSHRQRRTSRGSKSSSRRNLASRGHQGVEEDSDYDVNNPPSVPSSPKIGSLDDIMVSDLSTVNPDRGRDAVIDIDGDIADRGFSSSSPEGHRRRPTVAELAEMDVCFPGDAGLSEIGEEEERHSRQGSSRLRRRRTRLWPDLDILDEWSREEKEERTHQEHIRAKKIMEPAMVGGRLRAPKTIWHREEEDAPFRFTYFNELLDGTIHAQSISDLLQDGATFRDLFIPDPAILSDDSSYEDEDDNELERMHTINGKLHPEHQTRPTYPSTEGDNKPSPAVSKPTTRSNTPTAVPSAHPSQAPTPQPSRSRKPKKEGARPTFWLDVLNPTDLELKVLSKAFGIHQLTTEDIMVGEPREKVELFSNYYFVNYRSFEQDKDNEDYMEPVNMFVVVFRDGVITFHQSMTPHPANVRRRIRQLNDYMSPTADWISYAIIDDITDVYAPLVAQIEEEVDEIDDDILYLHQTAAEVPREQKVVGGKASKHGTNEWDDDPSNQAGMGAQKADADETAGKNAGDMLRRVGECRKKVMGLYRLLGNKADVIKGFAKRCNEHWEVAPRSEIGLYLGDIQDHIVTMTGNLSHYENLLSRAHSNYLAQINIRMNERAEQTADVLGKLTVLGTIVLPMNIITGMWGMNVWVPGQEAEGNLTWFWCITAGLVGFGLTCYFVAKKVYGIV